MSRALVIVVLGCWVLAGIALADEEVPVRADPPRGAGAADPKAQEAKALSALQEALERNTREIKALKEQYDKDMEQQRKRAEIQQK